MSVERVVLFGDGLGLPQLLNYVPPRLVSAIVVASNRRENHAAVQKIAFEHDLPLLVHPHTSDPDYPQFIAALCHFNPDIILVHSYSMILPPSILSLPRHGCINVHGGRLPEYRGANPIEWSIINGETKIGVTIHYIDEGIDTGDIIAESPTILLPYFYTWVQARDDMLSATDELLRENIPSILNLGNKRIKQDETRAKYHRRRTAEDGEFKWTQNPEKIYNLIRALVSPHPGAFYYDKSGRRVVIDWFVPYEDVVACWGRYK